MWPACGVRTSAQGRLVPGGRLADGEQPIESSGADSVVRIGRGLLLLLLSALRATTELLVDGEALLSAAVEQLVAARPKGRCGGQASRIRLT